MIPQILGLIVNQITLNKAKKETKHLLDTSILFKFSASKDACSDDIGNAKAVCNLMVATFINVHFWSLE